MLQIKSKVKLKHTGDYTGIGTIIAVLHSTRGIEYRVDWGDACPGTYTEDQLLPVIHGAAPFSIMVEARSREGLYILDSGSIPIRDVMKWVKTYQLVPGVAHIIMFRNSEQFKVWWLTKKGPWIHGGRLPKRSIRKGDLVHLNSEGKRVFPEAPGNPHFLNGHVVENYDKRWTAPLQVRWLNGFLNFYKPEYLELAN